LLTKNRSFQKKLKGGSPPFSFFKIKMEQNIKQDKGVAGLSVLMSVIVMLFLIGLIVMIFSIMGSKMSDATYTETTASVQGEDVTSADFLNATKGYTLAGSLRNGVGYSIVALYNNTNELLGSGNYTLTGNVLKNATALTGLADMKVNYTYTYDADNTATDSMNATYSGIANVTDWFEIFIVISAMVVLILLTVIIIVAIRGSGMVTGGAGSTDEVGSA
jgi:uncharacterized membrane protein